jgi:beta-glucanase (GH16 family)
LFANFYSCGQYQLIWSDEFDDSNLDLSKWAFDIGTGTNGWGNLEEQYYTSSPNNIKLDTGYLHITALEQNFGGAAYTSSRIKTQELFDTKYGKIESRIKLPIGQGLWPAFWMLGSNITSVGWPSCGEIDIMEHVNNAPDIHGTLHYDNSGHTYFGNNVTCDVTEFHVYSIEWDALSIKWFLDGTLFYTANIQGGIFSREEFHTPFFMILNLAVGGQWPGSPDGTTVFPASMFVDYVRVYSESVGLETEDALENISIYPNPSSTVINTIGIDNDFLYSITDLSGKLIRSQESLLSKQIDVSDLVSGIYIIELRNAEGTFTKRLRFVKVD